MGACSATAAWRCGNAAGRCLAAVVWILAVACETPFRPENGVRFDPPPEFRQWWTAVEQCSSRQGDFSRVLWYEIPVPRGSWGFTCPNSSYGLVCIGEWHSPHTIMLAGPSEYYPQGVKRDSSTVKHEMLHDLMQSGDHGSEFAACRL